MEVPVELAQQIINYLVTKPYADVHLLISELAKCKKVEANDVKDD